LSYLTSRKRLYALGLVLVTNFGFYILPVSTLNSQKVAALISLALAIVIAFAFSELSHQIKVERILYKYAVSGAFGIIAGIIAFIAIKDSSFLSMEWINSYGKLLLIALNVLAALYLFFFKGAKRNKED
jgi:hypothetical protein